jgi:hypothetical protein
MLCSLVEIYGYFGGTYCLCNQGRRVSRGSNMPLLAACLACSSALNAEAVGSFETSVYVYQSTKHYIPEDVTLEEVYYFHSFSVTVR